MGERDGPLRGADRQRQEALLALLRAVRQERGLHQTDVAAALGKPQSFVSKYESGARRLDLLEVRAVCDALGINLLDFVRRFDASLEQVEASRRRSRVRPTSGLRR